MDVARSLEYPLHVPVPSVFVGVDKHECLLPSMQ
jgi:hypothetical protein